jgi:hypothetical protein
VDAAVYPRHAPLVLELLDQRALARECVRQHTAPRSVRRMSVPTDTTDGWAIQSEA